MQSAQSTVNATQSTIVQKNNDLQSLKAQDEWWRVDIHAQIAALGVEIGGLYTALGSEKAGLDTAQGVLQVAQQALQTFPIEADPRVSGLYTEYGLATAALQTAQGILEETKQAVGAAAQVGDWILTNGLPNLLRAECEAGQSNRNCRDLGLSHRLGPLCNGRRQGDDQKQSRCFVPHATDGVVTVMRCREPRPKSAVGLPESAVGLPA